MKLAVLGTGQIVQDLMRTYDEFGIEKTYVLGTEKFKDFTEQLVADHNFDGAYYDYDELLEKADVDTVYVALPNALHYSFSKKAILAGKNVICEKPVTSNFRELKELMALAKEKDVILVEAMNIHHLPAYKALKEDIKNLGQMKIVSLNYSQYSSRYDAFKAGEILPAFNPAMSGGALMDINVYNIHTVVGLFGKPESVTYIANVERGIDTSGILTMDYGTFKAVCIGAKDCKAPLMLSYQGDEANVVTHIQPNLFNNYIFSTNKGETVEKNFDEGKHRLYYEFIEFNRMITEHDTGKANELLNISAIASELMENARKQVGVIFPND